MKVSDVMARLEQELGKGVLPRPEGATGAYDYGMAVDVDDREDGLYKRTRWHGVWSEWAKL